MTNLAAVGIFPRPLFVFVGQRKQLGWTVLPIVSVQLLWRIRILLEKKEEIFNSWQVAGWVFGVLKTGDCIYAALQSP